MSRAQSRSVPTQECLDTQDDQEGATTPNVKYATTSPAESIDSLTNRGMLSLMRITTKPGDTNVGRTATTAVDAVSFGASAYSSVVLIGEAGLAATPGVGQAALAVGLIVSLFSTLANGLNLLSDALVGGRESEAMHEATSIVQVPGFVFGTLTAVATQDQQRMELGAGLANSVFSAKGFAFNPKTIHSVSEGVVKGSELFDAVKGNYELAEIRDKTDRLNEKWDKKTDRLSSIGADVASGPHQKESGSPVRADRYTKPGTESKHGTPESGNHIDKPFGPNH